MMPFTYAEPLRESSSVNQPLASSSSSAPKSRPTRPTQAPSNSNGQLNQSEGIGALRQCQYHTTSHSDIGKQYTVPTVSSRSNRKPLYASNSADAIEQRARNYIQKKTEKSRKRRELAKNKEEQRKGKSQTGETPAPQKDVATVSKKDDCRSPVEASKNQKRKELTENEEEQHLKKESRKDETPDLQKGTVATISNKSVCGNPDEASKSQERKESPEKKEEKSQNDEAPASQKNKAIISNKGDRNYFVEASILATDETDPLEKQPVDKDSSNNQSCSGKHGDENGYSNKASAFFAEEEEDVILLSDDESENEEKGIQQTHGPSNLGEKSAENNAYGSVAYNFDQKQRKDPSKTADEVSDGAIRVLNSTNSRKQANADVKMWDSAEKAMATKQHLTNVATIPEDVPLEVRHAIKKRRLSDKSQAYQHLHKEVEKQIQKENEIQQKGFLDCTFQRWYHDSFSVCMKKLHACIIFLRSQGVIPSSSIYEKLSLATTLDVFDKAMKFWNELEKQPNEIIEQVVSRVQPFQNSKDSIEQPIDSVLTNFQELCLDSTANFVDKYKNESKGSYFGNLSHSSEEYQILGEQIRILVELAQQVYHKLLGNATFVLKDKSTVISIRPKVPSTDNTKNALSTPRYSDSKPVIVNRIDKTTQLTVRAKISAALKLLILFKDRYNEGLNTSTEDVLSQCSEFLIHPRPEETYLNLLQLYENDQHKDSSKQATYTERTRWRSLMLPTSRKSGVNTNKTIPPRWAVQWLEKLQSIDKSEWNAHHKSMTSLAPWIRLISSLVQERGQSPDRYTILLLLNVMGLSPNPGIQKEVMSLLETLQSFFPSHDSKFAIPRPIFQFLYQIFDDLASVPSLELFHAKKNGTSNSSDHQEKLSKRMMCMLNGRVLTAEWLTKILLDSLDRPERSPLWSYLQEGTGNITTHSQMLMDVIVLGLENNVSKPADEAAGTDTPVGQFSLQPQYEDLLIRIRMIFCQLFKFVEKMSDQSTVLHIFFKQAKQYLEESGTFDYLFN